MSVARAAGILLVGVGQKLNEGERGPPIFHQQNLTFSESHDSYSIAILFSPL